MFAIIGIVVVFGAVVGGYLMEHGNLKVLVQPAELLIIAGAGMGTLLIANPLHILKSIAAGLPAVLKGSKFTKAWYLDSLKMMYELFGRARRDGLVALESDTDDPEKSTIFSKYPDFLKDHHLLCFVCDTMRLVASNAVEAFELDQMVELDMDVHHHDVHAAGGGAQHRGGLTSRPRHRGRSAGRGHHHGGLGRPAGRDRA